MRRAHGYDRPMSHEWPGRPMARRGRLPVTRGLSIAAPVGPIGLLVIQRSLERGPAIGLATGLVTAATGVFVIPAVPYLQALGMEKEELVRALGISFLVSTIALAVALGSSGALQQGSRCMVIDLNSAHGTFVNSQRVPAVSECVCV